MHSVQKTGELGPTGTGVQPCKLESNTGIHRQFPTMVEHAQSPTLTGVYVIGDFQKGNSYCQKGN